MITMELGALSAGVKLASALWDLATRHLPLKSQKVSVSAFTYAAAGSEADVLMVAIPLVFFHSGTRPLVIEALRLVQVPDHGMKPLNFTAVLPSLNGTRPGERQPDRAWSQPLVVQPNQPATHICQFLRKPGKLKSGDSVTFRLEARLAGSDRWQSLRDMDLCITEQFSIRSLEQP
jgi:hypothetical protein